MKEFLMIGEFASLVNISTKTLRHYEKMGIFEPVYKDPLTGYRYYSRSQLKDIYILLSLKRSGIALRDAGRRTSEEEMRSLYSEASIRLQREIDRLKELKESIDRRLLETVRGEDEIVIEERYIPERRYYIHTFEAIDEADSPRLYEEAFKLEKIVEEKGLPYIFRGALLSAKEMREGRYSCEALIYEVEEGTDLEGENLYICPGGRYICLRYMGDTKVMNRGAMERLRDYLDENRLKVPGEAVGFAHRGAHTGSEPRDYYSEVQVRVEEGR